LFLHFDRKTAVISRSQKQFNVQAQKKKEKQPYVVGHKKSPEVSWAIFVAH